MISTLERRRQKLRSARGTYESVWKDCARYFCPRKYPVETGQGKQIQTLTHIYDAFPLAAVERFAGYLHSYLTSSVNRWFTLTVTPEEVAALPEVKEWLDTTENVLYQIFNAGNWASQMHELYLDVGVFGTGVLYIERDSVNIARFLACPVVDTVLIVDATGEVTGVMRSCWMTTEVMMQEFGDCVPEFYIKKQQSSPDEQHEIIHVVMRRDSYKRAKTAKPWTSIYYDVKTKTLLHEGGYDTMPYIVARWSVSSDQTYGWGPAYTALADAKMLQNISKTVWRAAEKAVDPPLLVPDDGVLGSVRLTPAGLTYVRYDAFKNGMLPKPLISGQRIDIGLEAIKDRRSAISQALFLDLFLAMDEDLPGSMTAREVAERSQEKMGLLSPILSRLMSEMLDPMIKRVVYLASAAGVAPQPPSAVAGSKVEVQYVSPLAVAQRLSRLNGLQNWLGALSMLSQVDPTVWDIARLDEIAREFAEIHSIPVRLLASEREVRAIRARREQTQAPVALGKEVMANAGNIARLAEVIQKSGRPTGVGGSEG